VNKLDTSSCQLPCLFSSTLVENNLLAGVTGIGHTLLLFKEGGQPSWHGAMNVGSIQASQSYSELVNNFISLHPVGFQHPEILVR